MITELQVGVITQTHGIRGEVKIFPTTDDAGRFRKLKTVWLDDGKRRLEMKITGVKFFKQYVIAKFEGYDSINDVEDLKGAKLFIERKNAVKLRKDEYFIADLIGMEVVTEDGEHFGRIKDVLVTGANDVYIVTREDASEVLLPAIKDCVREVNMEQNKVTVHIMDGLI